VHCTASCGGETNIGTRAKDQSDGNDVMSLNPDNMQVFGTTTCQSSSTSNSEGGRTSTNVAFDEAAVLDMMMGPTQGAISAL
jgi:hypothetical protein